MDGKFDEMDIKRKDAIAVSYLFPVWVDVDEESRYQEFHVRGPDRRVRRRVLVQSLHTRLRGGVRTSQSLEAASRSLDSTLFKRFTKTMGDFRLLRLVQLYKYMDDICTVGPDSSSRDDARCSGSTGLTLYVRGQCLQWKWMETIRVKHGRNS